MEPKSIASTVSQALGLLDLVRKGKIEKRRKRWGITRRKADLLRDLHQFRLVLDKLAVLMNAPVMEALNNLTYTAYKTKMFNDVPTAAEDFLKVVYATNLYIERLPQIHDADLDTIWLKNVRSLFREPIEYYGNVLRVTPNQFLENLYRIEREAAQELDKAGDK